MEQLNLPFPLTLNEYQQRAAETNKGTRILVDRGPFVVEVRGLYNALGLAGEAGEVTEKLKKFARDGTLDAGALIKEMGDVLWYLSQLARDYGFSLADVAKENLDKIASRKERGVLSGSGDNR